jgi:glucokinase
MRDILTRPRSKAWPGDFTLAKEPVLIGRPPLIRQTNAQILLKLLRDTGPCSKADLVRASGLSAPSVTNVVAHLASVGLVEALGEGDSTGGRPPDILRFRAERGCVAGVEIGPDSLHFLLADLNGRELGRSRIALERPSSTPPAVCARIGEEVRQLVRRQKHSEDQLLRLVVGVPAIVNVNEGIVVEFSALKDWSHVTLGTMLGSEFKCDVTVENDTNLAAQGEYYRGAAQGEKNFVFITIGEGVGAGIFVGGSLHRGSQWSAGEIGYLRVPNISRERPTIRKYGKLEQVVGSSGILKSWRASSQESRTTLRVSRAADVFDLAAAGNAQARRILKQRATILADVVLDLALILNPSIILLGGEVGNHPFLLQEVEGLLKGSEFAVVRVGLGALGDSAVLWGAICAALDPAILGLLQPSNPSL